MGESSIIYWLVCYLAGNFMTAYMIGKWNKVDLRKQHSKNLGATNAGRVLGRSAFVFTFLGDALKGALIILFGQLLNYDEWILAVGMLFVILGHLYPFWLKFHGGKGVATFIGAGIALEPLLFIWMILGTLVLYLFERSLTVAMLGGFSLYIASIGWSGNFGKYSVVILVIFLIIWKHRSNFSRKHRPE
ncbi:glycerol-3-phosphate acyltransferase [Ureibacillus chungkukjangi]|uniref:glycerol-3-phosphate acyltransferase n=1 Tax=Ureibacillus chungkukjangi TaxID=1202712 RepID=UPI00203D2EE0|nr:glycerol-3-phosphate acyltransferase [Ureibacillus chungkukjangi]MCM3389897.1 glycerol-3-phosphate acyltransferase [Ureibacillus chungkukjangi]